MNGEIERLLDKLKRNAGQLEKKSAMVGFDGFIDCIVRVVKHKNPDKSICFFNDMGEFGTYLKSKSGKSCSLELVEQVRKMGGNMPIFSMALGTMGVQVSCIGAMGSPGPLPEFEIMKEKNCTLYGIGESGATTALEFNDGKIMMAQMKGMDELTWGKIKSLIGVDKLTEFYASSHLIGLLNWSETEDANSIWEGILKEVMPDIKPGKNQILFFDLSDCSKKSSQDIVKALELIREFAGYRRVILGMNENEVEIIYKTLWGEPEANDLKSMGDRLYGYLGIDAAVIHSRKLSIAWEQEGSYCARTFYIDCPTISTGGGDNFNAGFCAAQLLGFDMAASIRMANAASACYIKNGFSPGKTELIEFLESQIEVDPL